MKFNSLCFINDVKKNFKWAHIKKKEKKNWILKLNKNPLRFQDSQVSVSSIWKSERCHVIMKIRKKILNFLLNQLGVFELRCLSETCILKHICIPLQSIDTYREREIDR